LVSGFPLLELCIRSLSFSLFSLTSLMHVILCVTG
jgi:hypothetical protein